MIRTRNIIKQMYMIMFRTRNIIKQMYMIMFRTRNIIKQMYIIMFRTRNIIKQWGMKQDLLACSKIAISKFKLNNQSTWCVSRWRGCSCCSPGCCWSSCYCCSSGCCWSSVVWFLTEHSILCWMLYPINHNTDSTIHTRYLYSCDGIINLIFTFHLYPSVLSCSQYRMRQHQRVHKTWKQK